jgi:hypothetical protein
MDTLTTPPQPHGNFVGFLNRSKSPGDNRPTFEGRLGIPATENEHRFALWAHEYTNPKTGEVKVMFNGQADAIEPTALPLDQVTQLMRADTQGDTATMSNVELAPRQLVLFPNGFKDEAPDKKRPDYWGAFNPGRGQPVVRISVWARKDRNDRVMLTGATSYPIPGKSEAEMQSDMPNLDKLVADGILTKGFPKEKAKGKAKARE